MATSAAAAKAPAEAPVAAPKKSNLLLVIVLAVVLLAAGGAGAWWFLGHSESEDEEEAPSKPAIFLPLEQFTVNLQPEDGQQFLQTAMTLKVVDQDVSDAIKAQMPEVRSRLLFLLSSKKPSQLGTVEGKNKLVEELIQEVEAVLPPVKTKAKAKKKRDEAETKNAKKGKKAKAKAKEEAEEEEEPAPARVLAVFFTHFIVQ